ncbi:piggyBac transposable element-derived protein 3-like [Aphis gossypii]|uniref:piggyBac transposable element-derived protein 3-like n=1 Tax=Aphis gossypii TaxID=80765 RepID=UPI00215979B8|nr:piggyBac transposable element-derived protein 3-like [Aphis gossypii]
MAKHILSDSQIIDLMNFDISDDDLDCSDVEFDLNDVMKHIDDDTTPLVFQDEYQELQQHVNPPDLEVQNENLDINNLPIFIDDDLILDVNIDDNLIPDVNNDDNLIHNVNNGIQKNINKPITFTTNELKQYIGITIFTSIVQIANVRKYWSSRVGYPPIKCTMGQKRFEQIKSIIHFNDNDTALPRNHEDHDRCHKLRPIFDHLNKQFSSIPLERDLAIDEQLCATKARSYLKQYLPLKPHKWGYKFFVLCSSKGYAYNFELYTGQENFEKFRLNTEPDLMASANVVVRLSRIIPENKNHRLYFDNYYTTIPLVQYMAKKGILTLGTVRRNRIPNCKFPSEKIMLKEPRGTSYEYLTVFNSVPITSVIWKDNKLVTLLSSYCGILPEMSINRFDKKSKRNMEVKCPSIIKEYNRHMGGVDLLDSLIGRYKIKIRTKKWYMRVWYHLIDISIVNAWLLYRRVENENGRVPKLSLFDFRTEVAFSLTTSVSTPKRGRPSNEEREQIKIPKKHTHSITPEDIRRDGLHHWPEYKETRQRCKYEKCGKLTQCTCTKCKTSSS